jgi:hypothetical protein
MCKRRQFKKKKENTPATVTRRTNSCGTHSYARNASPYGQQARPNTLQGMYIYIVFLCFCLFLLDDDKSERTSRSSTRITTHDTQSERKLGGGSMGVVKVVVRAGTWNRYPRQCKAAEASRAAGHNDVRHHRERTLPFL